MVKHNHTDNGENHYRSSNEELLINSLRMMKDNYYRIACIDLDKNSMLSIVIAESEKQDEDGFFSDYLEAIQRFAQNYVLPMHRAKFLNVMLPDRLASLFSDDVEYVDVTYCRRENGIPQWVMSELMPMPGYGNGHHRIMWYVKNISVERAMDDCLSRRLMQQNTDMNLRLETILNSVSGGFIITRADEAMSFEYVSEAAAAIQGYDAKEFAAVSGGSVRSNCYPADVAKTLSSIREQYRNGDTYCVKYRVMHRDGSVRWIQDNGKRTFDEQGIACTYSIIQDITEQEKQTAELQNLLLMTNQMVDSLNGGILAYTLPDHNILIANDEALRLFSLPRKNGLVQGNAIMSHIMPEDYDKIRVAVSRLHKPGDSVTYAFRTFDGSKILSIQAATRLLQFHSGKRFIISSMTDVTDFAELTRTLKHERTQYRDALTANCEFSFEFDVTANTIYKDYITRRGINTIREMGLSVPVNYDYMTRKWIEYMQPQFLDEDMEKSIFRDSLARTFEKGESCVEVEYFLPEFNVYHRMQLLLSRNEQTGHITAIAIATDTTAARRREIETKQAMQEAYEAANRANAAKTDFLAGMSHDIRTPMNAIIGMTAIAATHLDNSERVADCLNKITVSGKHLLGLINDVLDMSKIESGKIDLSIEEFNLSELVDNMLTMSRPQASSKNHDLQVNIHNIDHEQVIGDNQRIQQVFMNLMSNAVKYTPEGGTIRVSISEKPTNRPKIGCYEFIFEDNGIGMTPEFVGKIFEPFARANDSRVKGIQGTGLGMPITKNIVSMMNGTINVESEIGKGSKFTVTIFLELQNVDESINYEDFIGLQVLVADDDVIACETTCEVLRELGIKGEWVLSGAEAVECVRERHEAADNYFAVILDWKMPDMDGIATIKAIRACIGDELTIIISSANDWSDIELEARAAGANAFLSKPLFKSRVAHLFRELRGHGQEPPQDASLNVMANDNFCGKRALLVEDNEINMEVAGEILGMAGLEIEYAKNGREAVDIMSTVTPGYYDIVFMDIQMPLMNGYEATRAIRALSGDYQKRVPIIAMTANAFAEDVRASKNAGMNEHIAKPIDLGQLMHTLNKWLS